MDEIIKSQLARCQLVRELETLVWGIDLNLMKFYLNFKEALKLLPADRLCNKSLLTSMLFTMLWCFLVKVLAAKADVLHFLRQI